VRAFTTFGASVHDIRASVDDVGTSVRDVEYGR
jgi:hypothetical protein